MQAKTKNWKKIKVTNHTKTGSLKYNANYYYSGWRTPSMPTILKADYETCRTSSQNKGKIS